MDQHASAAPAPQAQRLPGLDLLRAWAIVWVMLTHADGFNLVSHQNWIVRFGWMGVDLFFVLSGFLIAGQLLRPFARGARPDYPRFFVRRLMRTLPAFLVVAGLYYLAPAVREYPTLPPAWQVFSFTGNLMAEPGRAFSHVWSLCVEEQFYLVFPALVALLALKPSPRIVLAAGVAVVLLGMGLRGWFWLHDVAGTPFDLTAEPRGRAYMHLIYYPTWTRLDGLLAGVAAAAIRAFRPRLWARITARPNLLLAAGLAGVIATAAFFRDQIPGFWPCVLGFPLLSLSMALMVAGGGEARSLIGRRALPGAGALAAGAYSLYLSHKAVFGWAASHAPAGFALPIAVGGALVVGAALYWGVERPFLKLRDRLGGRSRTPLAAEPATA
ncbi:MAG: acyltransferase [Phenylobacterium sp.]|nr:MAG: acyltransferase [Phenylobacterium sp.]